MPPETSPSCDGSFMLPKHRISLSTDASINSLSALSLLLCFICLYFYPTSLSQMVIIHLLISPEGESLEKQHSHICPPLTIRIFQKERPGFYSSGSLYIYSLCSECPSPFSPGELLLLFQYHLLQEIFPNPDSKLNQQPPTVSYSSWVFFCVSTDSTGL